MVFGSGIGKAVAVVVAVLVVLASAGAVVLLTMDRPRIREVDSRFGTVTEERTEVRTRLAVENPRLIGVLDAGADVEYTVSLNDVEVARGRKEQVDLSGGGTDVEVATWMDNSDIPRWWASHVNNDETTTVRVDPTVVVDYGGIRVGAPSLTRTRTVRTDLLEPLRTDRTRRLRAFGRTVLYVNGTDASWGEATAERTPLDASATVTNPTPFPIPLTNLTYTIRMNGIPVGEGEAGRRTVVPPGSTVTLDAEAAIDNSKLDEWWVSHLRRNQTSRLTVEFDASVAMAGQRVRLPLEALSYNRTFTTDILGAADSAGNESGSVGPVIRVPLRLRPRSMVGPTVVRPRSSAARTGVRSRPTEGSPLVIGVDPRTHGHLTARRTVGGTPTFPGGRKTFPGGRLPFRGR